MLVPVPHHWRRRLSRGYNQAELLAEGMKSVWDVEVNTSLLSRSLHKKSLTSSSRVNSSEKIKDVFKATDYQCEKQIVLVDDVLTTGSTLRALRCILEEKGSTVLGAAVLALA